MKAIILDFYGTIVREAHAVLENIAKTFQAHGAKIGAEEVCRMWWEEFAKQCDAAYSDRFRLQRELYGPTLQVMQKRAGVEVDIDALVQEIIEFTVTSQPFDDALEFLDRCPYPCYILSNVDDKELQIMVRKNKLAVKGTYTSEQAGEYKPRKGIFEKGLQKFGYEPRDVLYVGDSLRNDYYGARGAGIESVWLNRRQAEVPDTVVSVPDFRVLLASLLER